MVLVLCFCSKDQMKPRSVIDNGVPILLVIGGTKIYRMVLR